jgi:hypothetical protein
VSLLLPAQCCKGSRPDRTMHRHAATPRLLAFIAPLVATATKRRFQTAWCWRHPLQVLIPRSPSQREKTRCRASRRHQRGRRPTAPGGWCRRRRRSARRSRSADAECPPRRGRVAPMLTTALSASSASMTWPTQHQRPARHRRWPDGRRGGRPRRSARVVDGHCTKPRSRPDSGRRGRTRRASGSR